MAFPPSSCYNIPMKHPLLIFDWDGVLYDTMTMIEESYRRVMADWGLPVPSRETLRSFVGPSNMANALSLGLEEKEARRFAADLWYTEYFVDIERGQLYPGIEDMLRGLFKDGHTLCLVSNGGYNHVHAGLGKFHILPFFQDITTMRAQKTKKETFARLAEEFPHDGIIAVGDRRGDIEAGLSVGAVCIASDYGFGSAEEYAGAQTIVGKSAELAGAIARNIAK